MDQPSGLSTDEFTQGFAVSMTLMARVVQVLPMGLPYALWSGIGIVAYHQVPTHGQLVGMAADYPGRAHIN